MSAGYTTGNTETTDLGLGLDIKRTAGVWSLGVEAQADYGETDNVENKNRYFLASELDRQINDRMFGFGRVSYETDEFSGFDSRLFAGVGLGYLALDSEATKWSLRGGPGIKIDEVKPYIADVNGVPTFFPAETQESFSVIGSSEFSHAFNDAVSISNNTDLLYAQESTQIGNVLALTASLTNTLSARFSFDVRHDTNPPPGFEATDTATRIALVYSIGG